jgi:hypothetical protein
MNKKTAALVLLTLFLCIGNLPGEEPDTAGESSFYEEFFVLEGLFPNEEFFLSEEPLLSEDPIADEEPSEEYFIAEDSPLDEELDLFDETLLFEAPTLVFEIPQFIYETRSFDDIFPGLTRSERRTVFSRGGLKYFFDNDGSPSLIPAEDSGIDLFSSVIAKKPSHLIEAMVVVPYDKKELDLLDIYNALGNIETLKDYSFLLNNQQVNIFEETTRIESARNRRSISDPPPADTLPYAQTMYLRFKDAYYGNLFIRGDVSMSLYGMTYSLTNFTDIRYFLIPIMKAERIIIIMYLEPVKEGVLVYSLSGLYLPGFIADRVNITPSINRRITALLSWITDGLKRQESLATPAPSP